MFDVHDVFASTHDERVPSVHRLLLVHIKKMKILSHWKIQANDSHISANNLIHVIGRNIDVPMAIEQIGDAMCGTCVIDTIRVTIATSEIHGNCVLDYEAVEWNSANGTRMDNVNAVFTDIFKRCGFSPIE